MPEPQFLKRWFFLELLNSYKIKEILIFFLIQNSFLSSLFMELPSSVSVKSN